MIKENKASNYALYAIGEIILVVIGILIALQIDNWNKNQITNRAEIVVLENLYENLKLSKKQSEELIIKEQQQLKTLTFVLGIDADTIARNSKTVTDSIFITAAWHIENDVPVINSYADYKNTGEIGLIQNKTLRESFTNLETNLNTLKNMLDDRLDVHQNRIDHIAENNVNFVRLVKVNIAGVNIEKEAVNNYLKILEDKRTRNLLGMKLSMTSDVLGFREALDSEISEILKLIKSELEKKR